MFFFFFFAFAFAFFLDWFVYRGRTILFLFVCHWRLQFLLQGVLKLCRLNRSFALMNYFYIIPVNTNCCKVQVVKQFYYVGFTLKRHKVLAIFLVTRRNDTAIDCVVSFLLQSRKFLDLELLVLQPAGDRNVAVTVNSVSGLVYKILLPEDCWHLQL